MDETIITSIANIALTSPTMTSPSTAAQFDGDSLAKRRPAQALYKPPRRSKNSEATSPVPAASPTVDVQQLTDTIKPAKIKTSRPSAEPYVPPSRRSQPVNPESSGSSLQSPLSTNEIELGNNVKQEGAQKEEEEEEEEEEEWEKLLDSNDDSLNIGLVEEIQSKFKKCLQIKSPTHDYTQWSVDDIQTKEADLAHVLEVSNFPSTFRTEDLSNAFNSLTRSIFDIKWVDDTHALIVFPDAHTALDALQMEHPMFKLCPMSQASSASKKKAKSSTEFIQPYKNRPQTSSLTANRRICAALGLKNPMSNDKAKTERQKIDSARQKKVRDKEEQNTVWDGGVLPARSAT